MSTVSFFKVLFTAILALGGTGCWIQVSLLSQICRRRFRVESLPLERPLGLWRQGDGSAIVRFQKKSDRYFFYVADESTLRNPQLFVTRTLVETIAQLPSVIRDAFELVRRQGHNVFIDENNISVRNWLAGLPPSFVEGGVPVSFENGTGGGDAPIAFGGINAPPPQTESVSATSAPLQQAVDIRNADSTTSGEVRQVRRGSRNRHPTWRNRAFQAARNATLTRRALHEQNRLHRDIKKRLKDGRDQFVTDQVRFIQDMLACRTPTAPGVDNAKRVVNDPAYRYVLLEIDDHKSRICMMTCTWCEENWPAAKPDSAVPYVCERCRAQAARKGRFGSDNNTIPLIFQEQMQFAKEFHRRLDVKRSEAAAAGADAMVLVEPATIDAPTNDAARELALEADRKAKEEAEVALQREVATQIAQDPTLNFKIPRCPFDARHDVFSSATDMEKFCVSRIRLFAIILRRGGIYAGMKGTVVAFGDVSPRAEILSKLPNTTSPYVNIRIQKKNGDFPTKHLECQRVRRAVVQRMLDFLQVHGDGMIMADVVDNDALMRLPDTGYLHDLVRINVESGVSQPSRAEAVASAAQTFETTSGVSDHEIRLSQRNDAPRPDDSEPTDVHESDSSDDDEPFPQNGVGSGPETDDDVDDDEEDGVNFRLERGEERSGQLMDAILGRLTGAGVATGNLDVPLVRVEAEVDDSSDDESDEDAMETEQDLYENMHDDTLMHVQEQELSYIDPGEFNIGATEAARGLFNVVPSSNDDDAPVGGTQNIDIMFRNLEQHLRLTNPLFLPLAFPWLFCNMQGVPRFPQAHAELAALYPPQQHHVDPLDQINHLLRLGFRSAAGFYYFPFQATSLFMIVSRQIVTRSRSNKKCAWIFKNEYPNVTLDDLKQWLMEPDGIKKVLKILKRCVSSNVGEAAYFFYKLKLAKEMAAQLGNFNVFATRSFADVHHPVVLACLGLNLNADYQLRREVVGNAPGVTTAIFQMLADKVDSKFFGELLLMEFGLRRFEFQTRSAIHDHSVFQIKGLDYTDSVKAVVLGRASANQLHSMIDDLDESQARFAKCEKGFDPANSDYIDLSGKTIEELVLNVEEGRIHEKRLIQASELFLCGINPVVDEDADEATMKEQLMEFQNACRRVFKHLDVVTHALNQILGADPKTPDGRPLDFPELMRLLVNRAMIHHHVETYCFNTKARKATKRCRFNVPRQVSSAAVVDLEFKKGSSVPIVSVLPKMNHPELVPYCPAFLGLWRQNCDFRVIFDPDRIMRYTLKYTLKKDSMKPFLKEIAKILRGGHAEATVSPAAARIANKLKEKLYDNARQLIADMVNITAAAREVGMPEIFVALSSESMVRFHNIRFIYVPHIYDKRAERSDSPDGGVVLKKSIWVTYSNRMQIATEEGQNTLRDIQPDVLRQMSAAEFFGKFYVKSDGIVSFHVTGKGHCVTIWPDWCDVYQMDPRSPKFYIWAEWFLLRFVHWEAGESPKQFLKSFVQRTNDCLLANGEPPLVVDQQLDLSDESNFHVQDLILNCYTSLIRWDGQAKSAFETMIKPFHLVDRIRREERAEGDSGPVGVNQLPNNTPLHPEDEDGLSSADTQVPTQEDSDTTVPARLRTRSKTEALPPKLRKLHPQILGQIIRSAERYMANLPRSTSRFRTDIPRVNLNPGQDLAVRVAKSNPDRGGGIFIHGGPGTGKSTVIHELRRLLGESLALTATTGKAGFLIGGETVHSFLCLMEESLSDESKLALQERLKNVEFIVVDESSMLGCKLVDKIRHRLVNDAPRNRQDPIWGGYRLIFCGDFAQCPPVKGGKPFHMHQVFNELEVVLLTESHRITDRRSNEIQERIRIYKVTKADGEFIRKTCSPYHNPGRAMDYSRDWTVLHLVTTNDEVDRINLEYIQKFAVEEQKKIIRVSAGVGSPLYLAHGCKVTLLTNVRTDWGACNGMFATVLGILFEDNENDTIEWNERPRCVLVRPEDVDIDVGWDARVQTILRQENVTVLGDDGSYVPITETQILEICDGLKRVMPIRYESKKFSDEDGNYMKKFWSASIPLRLARAVTVHKVQGMTLDKLMFTPGSAKMMGTSLTAFTRCKGGFQAMLIMGNDDDEHLVEQFNRVPSDDHNLIKITEKLQRNYQATLQRLDKGELYQAVPSDILQTGLTTVRFG